jgi:hypothetical protein
MTRIESGSAHASLGTATGPGGRTPPPSRKPALKIYLADPTHDTIVLVSDTVPINVGFVGSYAKKLFGDEIEVSLFKYPQSVIDAIKADPPDVLALSNYSWNSYLSERLAQLAKQANPDVVTVQGGNNFPHEASLYREFLVDPHRSSRGAGRRGRFLKSHCSGSCRA